MKIFVLFSLAAARIKSLTESEFREESSLSNQEARKKKRGNLHY